MLESGQGFAEEVRHLVNIMRAKDPPAQTILVTATMSKAVKQLVGSYLPELQRIEAEGFHKPVATARHDFRPLQPGGDKMQQLLEVVQSDVAKGRKVLVFCNSMDSCRAVEHNMRERDVPTVCYHGEMPIPARKEAMAQFAGEEQQLQDARHFLDAKARQHGSYWSGKLCWGATCSCMVADTAADAAAAAAAQVTLPLVMSHQRHPR
jgi:superfamily II DNA/RNA helicase